ncbi:MAG: hypothetical protein CMJ31_07275 [Phycisphaerae bacterium]|nr:hypothetical protein [Phycisphaerae bacterium]
MAKILILQHGASQTPGRLGMTLRDHGFSLDIRRLDTNPSDLPHDLDGVQAVVSLGGAANIADRPAWLERELELLAAAHDAKLPVIGVCLGHQLVAKALGGEVGPMETPEAGFVEVRLTPPGQTDRILSGQRWNLPHFQSHGQQVITPPPGATVLGVSDACKVQIFRAGLRTYGFQYHFEMDRKAIDTVVTEQPLIFERAAVTPETVSKQCDEHYPAFARLADRLCVNIATLAFTFDELLKA